MDLQGSHSLEGTFHLLLIVTSIIGSILSLLVKDLSYSRIVCDI